MWDDEYEMYLRDRRNTLAEQNIIEHELSNVTMNEAQLDDEKLVELKKIKILITMILVVLICIFIVIIVK
jgi:hypothetical protein